MNKLILSFLLFLLSVCPTPAQNEQVQFINKPDSQKLSIHIDNRLFSEFLYSDTLYKQILYPIYTDTGKEITRGYPARPKQGERTDHPHQMGLWLNFGDVNGLDFWNNSYAVPADKKHQYGTIRFDGFKKIAEEKCQFTVSANWTDAAGHILLLEETTYTFSGKPHFRNIQRTTTLTAAADPVCITENKEGLLGMRMAKDLEEDVSGIYRNKEGDTAGDVWGKRSPWVSLSGTIENVPVSVTLIEHPGNPNYPGWSHARGYGLFAVNNLGGRCFDKNTKEVRILLNKGETITFAYKIMIKDGSPASDAEIEKEMGF